MEIAAKKNARQPAGVFHCIRQFREQNDGSTARATRAGRVRQGPSLPSALVHFFTPSLAHSLPFSVHCSLLTVHCSLCTANCPLCFKITLDRTFSLFRA